MSHKTAIKIYEIASYVLILGATAVFFFISDEYKQFASTITMALLALAAICRWMMDRHRYKSCDEENDMLKEDLRRLTLLLAEEKKKNSAKN